MEPEQNQKIEHIRAKNEGMIHYYGDTVRRLLMVVALIMLVGAPVFQTLILQPARLSIFVVLILTLIAGFMNPRQEWIAWFSFLVSGAGLVIFGLESIRDYGSVPAILEFITILISTIFLFALYYSAKTLRGKSVPS